MSLCMMPAELSCWLAHLAGCLDVRGQARLPTLLGGAVFARGRRTVTSWLRAAGVTDEFRPAYALLWTVGRRTGGWPPWRLCGRCCHGWGGQSRWLFAPDDTPTKRYGPCVQGAGVHHNPTPGPAGHKFVYGHVWVTLAWVARHSLWGSIALPPRAQPVRAAKGRAAAAAGVRLGLPHQAGAGGGTIALAGGVAGPPRRAPVAGRGRRLRPSRGVAGGAAG